MIPFLAVVKKEIVSVLRDRTIIISILIQLFIASFSSALLLGVLSLYDADTIMRFSGERIKIGMVSSYDNAMYSFLQERELTVITFASLAEAEDAMYRNEVSATLVIPEDANGEIKLYLPDSDTVSSLIRMVIQEPFKKYENYLRAQNGVEVRYTGMQGKPATSYEFVYSVLIPILMFFPAFVAGSMVIDSITEEVESNTLQTLLSAPLTVNEMVGAKIAASVILAMAQCAAWLGLLRLNGTLIENLQWIVLLSLIVAGITSTSAALAAVSLKDRERSQFVYSLTLLASVAITTLLDLSPIKTLTRLAVGDYYTSGWNVAVFVIFLAVLWLILLKISRRLFA